ncbi:site-specific integrase [Marinobacterium sediminicola]|uniref:Site-specific recombinase XerD n=1 Tax=Marinobacterium sediminicola TaxID=518898 RepID=A0ABY1S2Z7_9GAMM|nr:site-specific integrase [Marinobacterium sediminicola]ULG69287.1 tyrosine-type recombinase/integrase [Marinobacterium sediminicola]SMR77637.1 Site-specific recombinase XerD [Marinobacterium sediminicola]
MKVQYLTRRSSGLYYYRRDIPKDLRELYGKRELKQSLKTYDEQQAIRKAQQLTKQYDLEFERLRSPVGEREQAVLFLKQYGLVDAPLSRQPFDPNEDGEFTWTGHDQMMQDLSEDLSYYDNDGEQRWYEPAPHEARALSILKDNERVTLHEVQDIALRGAADKKAQDELIRCFGYFIDRLPQHDIAQIRTRDAQAVIDKLLAEGLKTTTVKKALGRVRKQVRSVLKQYDMKALNPFENVEILNAGKDANKRYTPAIPERKTIRDAVLSNLNLVSAQVVGLLFDTGCRCGEVGGLMLKDIRLEDDTPNMRIQPEDNRGLKTIYSKRPVPLTGLSLLVAKHIVANAEPDQEYAFPRYNKHGVYSNGNCAQAVNKWLKGVVPKVTTHSFRHAMSDRLYESGIPRLETNNLLGWSDASMANHYGVSEGLQRLADALDRMHSFERNKCYFD